MSQAVADNKSTDLHRALAAACAAAEYDRFRDLLEQCVGRSDDFWRKLVVALSPLAWVEKLTCFIILLNRFPLLARTHPIMVKIVGVSLCEVGVPSANNWSLHTILEQKTLLRILAGMPKVSVLRYWHFFLALDPQNEDIFQYWLRVIQGGNGPMLERFLRVISKNPSAYEVTLPLPELLAPPKRLPLVDGPLAYVLDDARVICKMADKLLQTAGYEVRLFEHACDLVAACTNQRPTLVFTDLNMPDTPGQEVVACLRSVYSIDELPIVLMTTPDMSETLNLGHLGVNGTLHKPFNKKSMNILLAQIAG